MRKDSFTGDQVGMIFYSNLDQTVGHVVSRKDFLELDPSDVGGWCVIQSGDLLLGSNH